MTGSAWISLDLLQGTIKPAYGGITDHHITVVYLGRNPDDEAFKLAMQRAACAALKVAGPLRGRIGGSTRTFAPSAGSDGKTVAYTPAVIDGLEQLRSELADLDASGRPDYVPHVTLSLLGPRDALPPPPEPTEVAFTHLSVHFRLHGSELVAQVPFGTGA